MAGRHPGVRQESDVLLRQLDGHLAALRARGTGRAARTDLAVAERVADALRRLVSATNRASAADRARVRAAVHFFVSRAGLSRVGGSGADISREGRSREGGSRAGGSRAGVPRAGVWWVPGRYAATPSVLGRRDDRRPARSLGDDVRIVNDILGELGSGLG